MKYILQYSFSILAISRFIAYRNSKKKKKKKKSFNDISKNLKKVYNYYLPALSSLSVLITIMNLEIRYILQMSMCSFVFIYLDEQLWYVHLRIIRYQDLKSINILNHYLVFRSVCSELASNSLVLREGG